MEVPSRTGTPREYRRLREQVERREGKVRRLIDANIIGIFTWNAEGLITEANDAFLRLVGHDRDDLAAGRLRWTDLIPPEWRERDQPQPNPELQASGHLTPVETEYCRKDGSRVPVLVGVTSFAADTGEGAAFVIDLSERKAAEEEHRAHLWFLESMDRINRAMQGTQDLERMMSAVLEAVLAIFAADRAWLTYPCDPDASSWGVIMEHTRPEFPGVYGLGGQVPAYADAAAVMRAALTSDRPVLCGPEGAFAVLAAQAERFGVRSAMLMAVRPKVDEPYLFGLHQCSHVRVWSAQEQRLFEEIGRRLADALTSVLMFRSLRASERRLNEAQRFAHVGYWERYLDAGRIELSDESCRIFGIPPEEYRAALPEWHERWLALIHPEDRPRIQAAAAEALRGGPAYDVEYRVVRHDGDVRIVHSRGEVRRDAEGPERMFGTMHDVTELRKAEAELRAAETRFRTLVDFAADAIMIHAEDGTVIDVNRHACDSLGYSRDELIGLTPAHFDVGLDAAALRQVVATVDEGKIVTFETYHRRKDGSEFPVEVRGRRVVEGDHWYAISLSRDISERKRAEAELRQARNALAHRQRVSMLGALAASLAHEIKQPIAATTIDATACLRALAADRMDVAEARRAASRLVKEATWADEIINRTRALYREGVTRRDRVDVNAVIHEMVVLMHQEAAAARVTVHADVHADLPAALVDRVQLQQVLMNLIQNAIDAMKDTGGELTITSRTDKGNVLVSVRDTGVGLPTGQAEEIFAAFVTTKLHGTGMGLAISRSIVEAHGGQLWAVGDEGPGATFCFTLPADTSEAG